jgi:hypothetical protein
MTSNQDVNCTCPHCSQALEVPEELLGKTVECPACKGAIRLPAPQPIPAPQPARNKVVVGNRPAAAFGGLKTKPCPMCGEDILAVAKKCKHCGSMLDGSSSAQQVSVTGRDPFAEYHTPIQGKKAGRLTVVGGMGVVLGSFLMVVSIAGCFTSNSPSAGEGLVFMFLIGAGIAIASFLWARR